MNFKEIKKYYKDKIEAFGSTAKGMDWKDENSQYLRFKIITKYINFNNQPSILDVGCGNSEFLNYCNINHYSCKYKGLDITKEMVDISNNKYGLNTAILGDLNSVKGTEKYDYVIASGTFNAKLDVNEEEWKVFFYSNLKKMYELSDQGIVFNCMTEHVDWKYDRLFYPDLSDITGFINKNLSKNFVIDHSYNLFEMTIYIFK